MEGRGSTQEINRDRIRILDDDRIGGKGERDESNDMVKQKQIWGG